MAKDDEATPMGVLVNPMGHPNDALSEQEYRTLKTCLEMDRSDSKEMNAITWAIQFCDKPEFQKLGRFLWFIASELQVSGFMMHQHGSEVLMLQDSDDSDTGFDEPKALENYISVLRRGGWFAAWLETRMHAYADKSEELPTPLQVAGLLVEEISRFNEKLEDAHEVIDNHPSALGFPPEVYRAVRGEPAKTPQPIPLTPEPEAAPADEEREEVPDSWSLTSYGPGGDSFEIIEMNAAEFKAAKKYIQTLRSRKPKGKKSAA